MISEREALERVLGAVPPPVAVRVPLRKAHGLRSAGLVLARLPLPGLDNSMMDGYAVRAAETADPGAWLPVVGTVPAGPLEGGQMPRLNPGEALRIFTGAPIPVGADAVIMQEDVERAGDAIRCLEPVSARENIRFAGSDVCPGQVLLERGEKVTAARIALLAAQGVGELDVFRRPRVRVVNTGDELVEADPAGPGLAPGLVFNSNGPMLEALARECGLDCGGYETCRDDPGLLQQVLESAAADCDALVLTGGVSVGERDHVREVLGRMGVETSLWRVRMKPGKPFLFATRNEGRPLLVFGLPGNPVSALVTFLVLARPALMKWSGAPDDELALRQVDAVMGEAMANPGDRPHYLRGRLAGGVFSVSGLQRSDALLPLSRANALLRLDAGESLAEGEIARVLPLPE